LSDGGHFVLNCNIKQQITFLSEIVIGVLQLQLGGVHQVTPPPVQVKAAPS